MYFVTFDLSKTSYEDVHNFSQELKNKFQNDEFIFMPIGFQVMCMKKRDVKDIIEKLTKFYETMPED